MELMTLRDAVARHVKDGQTIAMEGFTHLIPFAAAHEIIRQGRRDLHLVRMTPDIIYDQMIGAGSARALTFSWGGNPGVGSLHRLRDAIEHQWPRRIDISEHSHAGMAAAYTAGASNLPFGMLRGYADTDLPRVNAEVKSVTCPYSLESVATVPALRPDLTVLHAQRADRAGNVLLQGILGAQKEAAMAARALVVTVEEIVDRLDAPMNAVVLPGWMVTAVACVPGGAYPSYAQGYYSRDNAFYLAWDDISRERATFERWMDEHVLGVPDHTAYLRSVGVASTAASATAPTASPRLPLGVARDSPELAEGLPAASCQPPAASSQLPWTPDEMMTVAAARLLWNGCVCFVGIGLPSAAANLARHTHAPDIVLIYESGTVGTQPDVLPLSIGDGELAATATAIVPLPEVFAYWLQGGRVDVGFLGAAQIDRFGNLNSTVIGDYAHPKTRLPGAGGAPEIAAHARQVFVVLKQNPRTFAPTLDFRTSAGFLDGGGARARSGAAGAGPQVVITDLGVLRPARDTDELQLVARYEGVSIDRIVQATGWPLRVSDRVDVIEPPSWEELRVLRDLHERTRAAHSRPVGVRY
jgi:glutaconate CoA-transferase subunit A